MAPEKQFDFCVSGNGMVGSVTALALAQRGYSVAWIAPEILEPFSVNDEPDIRMSAISQGSVNLLEQVGVWQSIISMRAKPYSSLRVWETDGVETAFTSAEINTPQLGYFVENRLIQLACAKQAVNERNIQVFKTNLASVNSNGDDVNIQLENKVCIHSKWIIGAEGAQSQVRKCAGISTKAWQYEQNAMGIIVELNDDSKAETWQQFFPTGPCAFLPMHSNYAALIWYDDGLTLEKLNTLNSSQLKQSIESEFPTRLPEIKRVIKWASFPLTRMHASHYVKERSVLLGDAAHTVNPLAGQGVNMGFGDVKALLAILDDNLGAESLAQLGSQLNTGLNILHRQRNRVMMTALDCIYQGFKQTNGVTKLFRNSGLFIAQRAGIAKRQVIKFAAGLD
ncbi:FAD-dependent monooxygenase [Alteromonas sp. 5E99-2]|uniref:FAD-dependent monooxygenase n=1 Tax=Alteromonas sp. 5E99-2 TaxID=2817683 RepID=UPI001A9983B9|nr:FAD-dependent monooxygenase [Alteromonas sp. 5E99-2]MBO1255475.1 FAD-dependent monooxygenase [Alteromonas sp. 5E99-2]